MTDQVLSKKVQQARALADTGAPLPEVVLRQTMTAIVWPAFNRYARFNESQKWKHYEDFVRLCSAVDALQSNYEATPQDPANLSQIGAE